jgi:excisionase family DNA binding protein
MQSSEAVLLTVPEAAKRLAIKESTVKAWLLRRRLAFVRVGRSVRVPLAEIQRVIAEGTVPARELRDGR